MVKKGGGGRRMIMMGCIVMTVKMPRMVMIVSRRMMSYWRRTGIMKMMQGSPILRLHTEQDGEEGYNVVVDDDDDDVVVDDDDDYH